MGHFTWMLQDTLTQSLQICKVSRQLMESLEDDKKIIEKIPTLRHQVGAFEQVLINNNAAAKYDSRLSLSFFPVQFS